MGLETMLANEFAKKAKVNVMKVTRWIQSGDLTAYKDGKYKLVVIDEKAEHILQHGKPKVTAATIVEPTIKQVAASSIYNPTGNTDPGALEKILYDGVTNFDTLGTEEKVNRMTTALIRLADAAAVNGSFNASITAMKVISKLAGLDNRIPIPQAIEFAPHFGGLITKDDLLRYADGEDDGST